MTIDVKTASFKVSAGNLVIESGRHIVSLPVEQACLFAENLDLVMFLNQDLDWASYQEAKSARFQEVR